MVLGLQVSANLDEETGATHVLGRKFDQIGLAQVMSWGK